jgi:transposase
VTRHSVAAVNDLLSGLGVNRIRQLDERTMAMTTLADDYDYVIGGDPDRDTIDLAVLDTATGGLRAHLEESADGAGYARMLGWARNHAPGRRVWALEGTGGFAAGLVEELARAGEDVVEIGALKRARGAKNDRLDAVRAARAAMARDHQGSPRIGGLREAIRALSATRGAVLVSRTTAINELKSLIVVSPEPVRAQLRGRPLAEQLTVIETMTMAAASAVEHRMTVFTMHSITARIRFLTGQLDEIDPELLAQITAYPAGPALPAETGVGPVVAAQLLISWSHPGRLRSEAAFASLAGVAPLEASSGQRSRHRLNRRRPRPEPGTAHRRHHPHQMPRRDPGIRSPAHPAGQDPPRHPPLPQAHLGQAPIPRHGSRGSLSFGALGGLTNIGASNRLLRFWLEKGSDLSVHTPDDLRRVAAKLNRRPRPTLNLETPASRLNQLLLAA